MKIKLIMLISLLSLVGCTNPNDPINMSMERFEKAVTAIFNKAAKDSVVTGGQIQGNVRVDKPGYRIHGYAGLFQGIHWDGVVEIIGVGGDMNGAMQLGNPDVTLSRTTTEQ